VFLPPEDIDVRGVIDDFFEEFEAGQSAGRRGSSVLMQTASLAELRK
jgi:hypothetical protein